MRRVHGPTTIIARSRRRVRSTLATVYVLESRQTWRTSRAGSPTAEAAICPSLWAPSDPSSPEALSRSCPAADCWSVREGPPSSAGDRNGVARRRNERREPGQPSTAGRTLARRWVPSVCCRPAIGWNILAT